MFKKDNILFALFIVTTGMLMAFGIYYVVACIVGEVVVMFPAWVIAVIFVSLTLITLGTWRNHEHL